MSDFVKEETTQHKKRHSQGFRTYIKRVLKIVHPDLYITGKAVEQVNHFCEILAEKLSEHACNSIQFLQQNTINSRSVQYSILQFLDGELCKFAISEGTKAVTKYNSSICENESRDIAKSKKTSAKRNPSMTKQFRAGLTFPVATCRRYLKHHNIWNVNVSSTASIYLAAVLEYLTAELLELAGNQTQEFKKSTVNPRFLFLAIDSDPELKRMCNILNIGIDQGGATQYIHESLVPRAGKKKGNVAMREIRTYQKTGKNLMQYAPFRRLVVSMIKSNNDNIRFSKGVVSIIQGYIELHIVKIFSQANLYTIHAKRQEVCPADIELVRKTLYSHLYLYGYDCIQLCNVTKPALVRLARRAGVKRIDGLVYEHMRGMLNMLLQQLLHQICIIVEHMRIRTVSKKVLRYALSELGQNFLF